MVLVHAVVTVLLPVTPPGLRDALAAVSTLPLVSSALHWCGRTVLDTEDQDATPAGTGAHEHGAQSLPSYLLVRPVFAVVLAVAEPLSLQALVAVGTLELHRAPRGSRATRLIGVVAAVGISVTSEALRHTLTAGTAVLVSPTRHQAWKEAATSPSALK